MVAPRARLGPGGRRGVAACPFWGGELGFGQCSSSVLWLLPAAAELAGAGGEAQSPHCGLYGGMWVAAPRFQALAYRSAALLLTRVLFQCEKKVTNVVVSQIQCNTLPLHSSAEC